MQSLWKIVQRAPAVGAKMWCLSLCLFVIGRIAAQRQTAGIKFTHRPKIRFFAPQGRLVAPIHVKLGRVDGHRRPFALVKFSPQSAQGGGNAATKISKIFTFW